ncbi:hypothetical protein GGR50DRAFT_650806 [Xylaria sp. CBS 124048]|nr:hypothetical protein GGR50DRAFT_650806 [Xylaria sp. CBS 124048]
MPDLNSIPLDPQGVPAARGHRTTSSQDIKPQQTSQQPSQQASPLAMPTASSLHILPSNQQTVQTGSSSHLPSTHHHSSPDMAFPPATGQDATGPLRHPRPLTASELHSQLEQEQEYIVNRLSRDLTMLRMSQNASVVSNASSTSASTSAVDQMHPSSFTDTHMLSGPGYPVLTGRRHHRTSSSTSARSLNQTLNQGTSSAPIAIPLSHSGSAASILEAARNPRGAMGISRQNSTASRRTSSRNRSPQPYPGNGSILSSSLSQSHGFPPDFVPGSYHYGRTPSGASMVATPGSEISPGFIPATGRYEETAIFRNELESAKRENEALKRRIKELEKILRERKENDAGTGRLRSESGSTAANANVSGTTSVGGLAGGGIGVAGDRREERRIIERAASANTSVAVGVPDEELEVGESAATTTRSGADQTEPQGTK